MVLHLNSATPVNVPEMMSKPLNRLYEYPDIQFFPNETYYVGAMYTSGYFNGILNYS